MSFREVKSMLRMLNIDMDDVYASKLFKVPIVRCRARCARCWLREGIAGSFSALPSAGNCQAPHTEASKGWVPPGAHGGEG